MGLNVKHIELWEETINSVVLLSYCKANSVPLSSIRQKQCEWIHVCCTCLFAHTWYRPIFAFQRSR